MGATSLLRRSLSVLNPDFDLHSGYQPVSISPKKRCTSKKKSVEWEVEATLK